MVRLWISRVERVVRGAVRGGIEGEPERRVAWVEGERAFGFGRRGEGEIEMRREVAEEMGRKRVSRGMRRSSMFVCTIVLL